MGVSMTTPLQELIHTFDPENLTTPNTTDESTKSHKTLTNWLYCLMQLAMGRNLTTATISDINGDINGLYKGIHPHSSSPDGVSKNTLRTYQLAVKAFYRFHDYDIDPNDIALVKQKRTHVDDRDMLSRDEIHELRGAADNPRDKMVVDLLIYSGQRQGPLRTLRIKDIDLDDATYRYNTDDGGLKGADKRQGKRPLLLAESSVRTWINDYHPDPLPDHYLITTIPSYSRVDPTEPVNEQTMRNVTQKLKDRTDIDKPCYPHALRHNFVIIAVKEYNMDPDEVKFAIGHAKDSMVMEETYSHLSASDYTHKMKVKAG
jgi:integrase/recombinase XerD